MDFNKIIDTIVSNIESCSDIEKSKIKKALNVQRGDKFDFVIFFNQISDDPVKTAADIFKKLTDSNFPEIINIKHNGSNISFDLNKEIYFKDILKSVHFKKTDFGKNNLGAGKTVVVEYSSPNIAKLFHVGHYRTTILGNFVKNLLKACKFNTVSMNYLGDWGKQFGMVLLGFEKYGSEEKLKSDALMHLFEVYVKINEEAKTDSAVNEQAKIIFKEMEEYKNEKYLNVWRRFRKMSIEKYTDLYKKLNIEFDVYSGESLYNEVAKEFAENCSISITDEDGSKFVDCDKLGKTLIQKSDGTTLYLTRDICAAKDRVEKYNPIKILYVVAHDQEQHLAQLFSCMGKLGYDQNIFQHINYGRVNGMSTRNGNVHFIEDIIESSSTAIKERLLKNEKIDASDLDKVAYILALSTLLVADFGAKRIKGYTFNAKDRANCEKGSGAYLQYAHCRLKSIEEVNAEVDLSDITELDFNIIDNSDVHDLCYKLLWYERIIELCLIDYEPSRLVLYLMDLVKTINNLISKLRVKGENDNLAKARLLVFSAARQVIKNGLEVLGIIPLNRM